MTDKKRHDTIVAAKNAAHEHGSKHVERANEIMRRAREDDARRRAAFVAAIEAGQNMKPG